MTHRIIQRPIAVSMLLIAIMAMGVIAMRFIPISLMPDVDIPQITVQTACPGYSAQEAERQFTSMLRGQLMQVDGVKDIRSESRADMSSVVMLFEPGTDMDLMFIQVNEKIDRAMNFMPREMERPKVIKAGVMDIPAFYVDVWLKNDSVSSGPAFAQLGRFARNVLCKRIEQLPQTAMVDVSGTIGTEIVCMPDNERMLSLGLTPTDIETVINRNNITLEALSVADGIYRYRIHFDSQILTKDDIENIYFEHQGRLLQIKDVCDVEERMQEAKGIVRHNGHRAVTLAVIKQNDARMDDLKESMRLLLDNMENDYPELEFSITRDQTHLLSYTIDNLKGNLVVGVLLACLVILLFLREWRLSLLVAISIPVSLVIALLAFYCMGMSLNVISLSGLILGAGMIVDNSIIVIDNVMRRWKTGERLQDAVVGGTREVFTPMLSSMLTTCSIFLPLMFLSGTAGALFFDQAMGVSFSLAASLAVATIVMPVFLNMFFRHRKMPARVDNYRWIVKPYENMIKWGLRHIRLSMVGFLLCIPLAVILVFMVEKRRMPELPENDAMMYVDWNADISPKENDKRMDELMSVAGKTVTEYTSMAGKQDFLLSHTKDITSSEAIVYLKTENEDSLVMAEKTLGKYMAEKYPTASMMFSSAANIYSLMFSTDESDLEIRLQTADGKRPDISQSRAFADTLRRHFPNTRIMPVVAEQNVRYVADVERMALYKVSYGALHNRMRQLVKGIRMMEINDGAQSIPVLLCGNGGEARHILEHNVRNEDGVDVPIHLLVREGSKEDYKHLEAAAGGEYYGIGIDGDDKEVESVMSFVSDYVRSPHSRLSATFTGGYFSSRQLLGELALVLTVAIALLYFILAAQFESLVQPLIILTEIVVDIFLVLLVLWVAGISLNVMSMTGIVVMSGIVVNDSILKVDTINGLRRDGCRLLPAIILAGHQRLRPIIMTSLTTILALLPFLNKAGMGAALQFPMSVTLVIGMTVGTFVSLFFIPVVYYFIYRHKR